MIIPEFLPSGSFEHVSIHRMLSVTHQAPQKKEGQGALKGQQNLSFHIQLPIHSSLIYRAAAVCQALGSRLGIQDSRGQNEHGCGPNNRRDQ